MAEVQTLPPQSSAARPKAVGGFETHKNGKHEKIFCEGFVEKTFLKRESRFE
jgi:hypothetical protein